MKRGLMSKVLWLLVIVAVLLFGWAEYRRRSTASELKKTEQRLQEIEGSANEQRQEVAKEILEKVKKHVIIDEENPTVATIVDVEKLREKHVFYQKAENGYHLVITKERAILYDADRDIVVDVVPVILNNENTTSPLPSPIAPAATSPDASL
ncbi:MAG: hypothetical protein WD200_05135 [Candidatus Andersenbacteria bacterium]